MKWIAVLVVVGGGCAGDLQRDQPGAADGASAARDANPGEGFFDAAGSTPDPVDASEQQLPDEIPPVPPGVTPIDLLPRGASWRYLDDGSDQGTAWSQRGFDSSTWLSGNAELGYGEGDETTVVSFGDDPANKFITTYFRRGGIQVDDPTAFVAFVLDIKVDDGAVIYVNGTELRRLRFPEGATIDYLTQALEGTEERVYDQLVVPAALITAGSNLLAIEVHQNDPDSSDISFDVGLVGIPKAP